METLLTKLKKNIIKHLRQDDLDIPYLNSGVKTYTRRELIAEIELESNIGSDLISNLVVLTLDLVDRNKEKLEQFDKCK